MAEHPGTLIAGGVERTFHVLHAGPAEASALLLVLHGSDSDAARFRELSGHTFDRLVTDGVVVAYAEAYGGIWNDARLGTRSPLASVGSTTWSSSPCS